MFHFETASLRGIFFLKINILWIKVLILEKKRKKIITRLHPIDMADLDMYQILL